MDVKGEIRKEKFDCLKCGKHSMLRVAKGWILDGTVVKEETVFVDQPRCDHCGSYTLVKDVPMYAVPAPVKPVEAKVEEKPVENLKKRK